MIESAHQAATATKSPKFCGICHSDIHQAHNEWGGSQFPMMPGHEIAGIVAKVGAKVSCYEVGDRVLVAS